MNKKRFETTLPDGYRVATVLDAKSKKVGLFMNLAALVLMLLVAVPLFFPYLTDRDLFFSVFAPNSRTALFIYLPLFFLYLILHELTHGAAYKWLTGEKLTFGLSWSCAFCGVPNIFTYRKTALYAVLAPFVLFTILMIPALAITYTLSPALYIALVFLFASHVGGCAGDLYVALLLFTRYRDDHILMNDTGPRMTLYVYDPTLPQ